MDISMDPVGAATGLIGGIANLIGSRKNVKRQIKAQQEENEKNRVYNLQLAEKQNQWNIDQWNRSNAYNDPSAMMSRYKAAGINPDLAFSNGAAPSLAAVSPEMTAGAPSSPVDMSALATMPTMGQAILQAQNSAYVQSQIDLNKAEAGNKEEDTIGKRIENHFKPGILQGQIDLNKVNIDLGSAEFDLKPLMAKKLNAEVDNINESTSHILADRDRIYAVIQNDTEKVALEKIRLAMDQDKTKMLIKKMAHDMYIDEQHVRNEIENILINGKMTDSNVALNWIKGIGMTLTNDKLGIELQDFKDTHHFDKTLHYVNGSLDTASKVIGLISNFVTGGLGPGIIKSFSK